MVPAVAAVYQIPEVQCFAPHALHRQIFNLQSVQQGPGYGVIGEAVTLPGGQAGVGPGLPVGPTYAPLIQLSLSAWPV